MNYKGETYMAKNKPSYTKRVIILILIFVLALVTLAIPVVSSLGFVSDYINIGTDILSITDIFSGTLAFSMITDNLPMLMLAVFLLFALILVLKALISLFSHSKNKYFLLSLITFLLALAYFASTYNFNFTNIINDVTANVGTFLSNLDYGIYGMIGCPILVLLLGFFAYKKD